MQIDILIGRLAAKCAHPYAAWRTSSTRGRLIVFLAYSAIGYLAVLTALTVRWR
jgi:hypothetical protein